MAIHMTRRDLLCAASVALALPAGTPLAAAPASLDSLLDRRRMVRRFKPDPLPESLVQSLLSAAARAPSAGNTQPWAFIVVRDADIRIQLARAAFGQMFVAEAPVVIVACTDVARSRARYQERGERYGLIDTAFASLLLLLAVTEQGLGACFVGAFEDGDVARLLSLPKHVKPVAIVPVGYPAEAPRAQKLRPLAEAVHSERWSARQ